MKLTLIYKNCKIKKSNYCKNEEIITTVILKEMIISKDDKIKDRTFINKKNSKKLKRRKMKKYIILL